MDVTTAMIRVKPCDLEKNPHAIIPVLQLRYDKGTGFTFMYWSEAHWVLSSMSTGMIRNVYDGNESYADVFTRRKIIPVKDVMNEIRDGVKPDLVSYGRFCAAHKRTRMRFFFRPSEFLLNWDEESQEKR